MEVNDSKERKIIFKKYRIIKLIYSSGFADVYKGINEIDKIPVAIKVEKKNSKFKLLESEAFLLMNLKGFGIPKIITYGHYYNYNVLIEELLGKSLDNIYTSLIFKKFNLKDICMIAIQALQRLEFVHSKFVVHRDIKPQNFVIGRNDPYTLYLIDFGLSRKYRSSRTHKHIKFNNLKLTYGSLRYLSINGNKGYEQSRRDDVESLGYMLVYLATGTLPWIKDENTDLGVVAKYLKIHKIKEKTSPEQLCVNLPEEMAEYIKYCRNLNFCDKPNYNYLIGLFENILIKNQQKNDLKFSWLPKKLLQKKEENKRNGSKKKSLSPFMRLFKKMELNSGKLKRIETIDITKQNENIGYISHINKPIHLLYEDFREKTNININKINEEENSIKEGEEKKKLKKKLESESTREKDIKGQNTDKSLSTSYDKRERYKYKKRIKSKKIFIYTDNTNNSNEKNIATQNQIYHNNSIINNDDEENKKLKLNKILSNSVFIPKIESNIKPNNEAKINKKEIYKSIKFISNNNFWDGDSIDKNEESYNFNTYNNIDLKCFDIYNYHTNNIVNNKVIKEINSNNHMNYKYLNNDSNFNKYERQTNLKNDKKNYRIISQNNSLYVNNNFESENLQKNERQKINQLQKKNLVFKSSKSQTNENQILSNYKLNNIVKNSNKNFIQIENKKIINSRESKEKNNYIYSNDLLKSSKLLSQNLKNKPIFDNLLEIIFYKRKTNINNNEKINNKITMRNNFFCNKIRYDDIY